MKFTTILSGVIAGVSLTQATNSTSSASGVSTTAARASSVSTTVSAATSSSTGKVKYAGVNIGERLSQHASTLGLANMKNQLASILVVHRTDLARSRVRQSKSLSRRSAEWSANLTIAVLQDRESLKCNISSQMMDSTHFVFLSLGNIS